MSNKDNNTTTNICGNENNKKMMIKETINIFDNNDNDNNIDKND